MKLLLQAAILNAALLVVASATGAETLVRVTDINPGSRGSFPSYLTLFNNQRYFRANTGLNNVELESSSDLFHWTPAQPNRPLDGQIFFNEPAPTGIAVKIHRILKAD